VLDHDGEFIGMRPRVGVSTHRRHADHCATLAKMQRNRETPTLLPM
jgi:hypothetical protein